jgi:hypothetical protein
MKLLTSSISDPFVHVLAIGLLLVYLAMTAGGETKANAGDDVYCQRCQSSHGEFDACLAPTARPAVSLAAH